MVFETRLTPSFPVSSLRQKLHPSLGPQESRAPSPSSSLPGGFLPRRNTCQGFLSDLIHLLLRLGTGKMQLTSGDSLPLPNRELQKLTSQNPCPCPAEQGQ